MQGGGGALPEPYKMTSSGLLRNTLPEGGMRARHSLVGPVLTAQHRAARMAFARIGRFAIGIDAIDWPSRSPDLNPIEKLTDIMHRCICRRQVAPQTVQELTDALIQVWEEIPQSGRSHIMSCPDEIGSACD